ncbi:MAG: hypothetical protein JWR24_5684 [Actinoallomurus sp.]|nr:hypothetical protein [Actinoallomurus sp.]
MARRMVDIDEDGMKAPALSFWIETPGGAGHREEIAADQTTPGIRRQPGAERYEFPFVPLDHFAERLHNNERAHAGVLQYTLRGVTKTKSPYNDVEVSPR